MRTALEAQISSQKPAAKPKVMRRWPPWLLILVLGALCTLALTVSRTWVVLANDSGLDNSVSGVWLSMGADLANGIFYRPLVDESGFGGTRYMPLNFILIGGMIAMGVGALASGYILTQVSLVALVTGAYVLLRRVGVRVAIAFPSAILVLCNASTQHAATNIRGNLLPAALNLWGIACCCPLGNWVGSAAGDAGRPRPRLALAAMFFTLAFAAKLSTLAGVTAAGLALIAAGRWRQALGVSAMTAGGCALVLVGIHLWSQGRFLESMTTCAGGDTTLADVVLAPYAAVSSAKNEDPVGLAFVTLAICALVVVVVQSRRSLVTLLPLGFLLTGIVTVMLYAVQADYNHLLDLEALAVTLFVVLVAAGRIPRGVGLGALGILGIVGAGLLFFQFRERDATPARAIRERVLAEARVAGRPTLYEDAGLPVLDGEQPYVLDSWTLKLIFEKDEPTRARFLDQLTQRFFKLIVLHNDPETEQGRKSFDSYHFGPGFVTALLGGYTRSEQYGPYILYRPRP